jgi:hypothetical protein
MFDPATMGAALASLKTIVDLMRNANDAQLSLKISGEVAQVQGRLLDVQQQALTLHFENERLRAENEKLRSRVFHHSVNWRILLDGTEDGPFCPICASEGRDMRLAMSRGIPLDQTVWHFVCPPDHVPTSGGRQHYYAVPKALVPEGRYVPST